MDDQQRQSGSESSDESESQTNNDFQTSPFGSETNSEVESESKSQIPSDWEQPAHYANRDEDINCNIDS